MTGLMGLLDGAWALVGHARESSWWNPRRLTGKAAAEHDTTLEDVLRRLEDGVARLRNIARTVDESTRSAHAWDERFREPWVGLLDDLGRCITALHNVIDVVDDTASRSDAHA